MHGEGLDVFSSGLCGVWAYLTLSRMTYCFASHIKTQTDIHPHFFEEIIYMNKCAYVDLEQPSVHNITITQNISALMRQRDRVSLGCYGNACALPSWRLLAVTSPKELRSLWTPKERSKRERGLKTEKLCHNDCQTHMKRKLRSFVRLQVAEMDCWCSHCVCGCVHIKFERIWSMLECIGHCVHMFERMVED